MHLRGGMNGGALVDPLVARGSGQLGQVGTQRGRPGLHVAAQLGQHAEGTARGAGCAHTRIDDAEDVPGRDAAGIDG